MSRFHPLFDTHCHLLPAVDDGSASWDESLAMARYAASDGIRAIVVTPHQFGAYTANTADQVRQMTGELQRRLLAQNIPLQAFPGSEIRLEPDLARRIGAGEAITLADQGRHVLLELPHEIYVPCENVLLELRRAGLVAVLAHPERNAGVQRQPAVLQSLVHNGCLLQVTAGSLLGRFGSNVQKLAESLIDNGMVSLVATDAHGMKGRRPGLAAAYGRITERWDETTAMKVCCENPARVVEGNDVLPVRPVASPRSWGSWFRRRAAG